VTGDSSPLLLDMRPDARHLNERMPSLLRPVTGDGGPVLLKPVT